MPDNNKIVAFGEIMLRLSSPNGALDGTNSFDACYGGTEANVLAAMYRLGHSVKYLTALPDNGLGTACKRHLESNGIDTADIVVGGDNLGVYFVDSGVGSRGANVIYYRKNSEFTKLDIGSFDFDKVFDGARLFHISGISFALSDTSRELAFALMENAKRRGITVSFDFNYRAKLWSVETAKPILCRAASYADIVLAGPLDLKCFLDTDVDGYFDSRDGKYFVLRDRRVISPTEHAAFVSVVKNGSKREKYTSPDVRFPVKEKIGGGDAFDGAMLHALLSGMTLKDATCFALGAFALKATITGDTFTGDAQAITDYMRGLGL